MNVQLRANSNSCIHQLCPGYIARSLVCGQPLSYAHAQAPSLPPPSIPQPHLIFIACMNSAFLASPTAATTSPIASTSLTPFP